MKNPFNDKTKVIELFQNAYQAGAEQIEVTTFSTDDGTVVEIADNGRGASYPDTLRPPGREVQGLTQLREHGYTVRSNTENNPSTGWTATLDRGHSIDQHVPEKQPPDERTPQVTGTTVTFPTTSTRNNVRKAAQEAAAYLPIPVLIDEVPADQTEFLDDAGYRAKKRGVHFAVYRYKPTVQHDVCLAGEAYKDGFPQSSRGPKPGSRKQGSTCPERGSRWARAGERSCWRHPSY